jgi:hypothetical protein
MAYADNDFFAVEADGSMLPTDDGPSLGSNYGMDGFQFDSEYGDGVLDGGRLPEVAGLSALPDGLIHTASPFDFATGVMLHEPEGSDYGTNLSAMLEENSLAELGWLHGEQDPNRLPKNPVDRGIKELEKAWGTASGYTTGNLVPNRDNVYQAPTGDPHEEGFTEVDAEAHDKILRQAARRSAYGHPLAQIVQDTLTPLAPAARKAMTEDLRVLARDHGLRGKVFIEAHAFPGLKKGKFASELHRFCADARYVVVPQNMDRLTRDRIASITGKTTVTEVPWREAFNHYAPRLASVGHKVATTGNYRERLRDTLAAKERVAHESTAPIQTFAVDQISRQEAYRKFAVMEAEQHFVPDAAARRTAKETREAKDQIVRWVEAGLLTQDQAVQAHNTSKSPSDMVVAAAALIAAPTPQSEYTGVGVGKTAMRASAERKVAALVDTETLRKAKAKQAALQQLHQWVERGLLPRGKANRIASSSLSPQEMVAVGAELIASARREGSYEGDGVGRSATLGTPERALAPAVDAKAQRKAKWLLTQMNEGWAGKKLTELVRKRFADKTASTSLNNVRAAHEGLAGFVYVDASVYASDKGSSGCDTGALQHRANSLRYVLAMERCESCVFATEGKCQKYAKTLLESNTGLEQIQKQNIRQANMGDAEATGSLFASAYQNDYGLQYDESVDIDDDLAVETLSDVFMDGVASMDNNGDLYEGLNLDDVGF